MAGLSISPSTVRALTRCNERWSKKLARGNRRPQIHEDNNGARRLFWFEEPEGFRPEEGRLPAGVILHGPFRTEAEVKKHIRLTILGPQCNVIEGGEWDPNWDKPQ